MILLCASLRCRDWRHVSEQEKRQNTTSENQVGGDFRIRDRHTVCDHSLFVFTKDFRFGDRMRRSLRRIVKRELVLKTPCEHC